MHNMEKDMKLKMKSGAEDRSRKTYSTRFIFGVVLAIVIAFFCPSSVAKASFNQGGVNVAAFVTLNPEFEKMLAREAVINIKQPLVLSGGVLDVEINFSTGKEAFHCGVLDEIGQVLAYQQAESMTDGIGRVKIQIPTGMVGLQTLKCQATGYERVIDLDQRANFFVVPSFTQE